MEFKYSFIGNCSETYNSISLINQLFDDSFLRETATEISSMASQFSSNQIATVYLLKNLNIGTIKIAPGRIDFVFGKEENRTVFLELFNKMKDYMPKEFNRIAININDAFTDGDRKKIVAASSKDSLTIKDSIIAEYLIRKNLRTKFDSLIINNIITIQNAMLKSKKDFSLINGLVFSIDINNVPVGIGLQEGRSLGIDDTISLFDKMRQLVVKDKEAIEGLIK